MEYLKLKHDYAISPDDSAFMFVGTRAHEKLEGDQIDEHTMSEFYMEYSGIKGTLDAIQTDNDTVTLMDTKTSGSYKVGKILMEKVEGEEEYVRGPKKGQKKMVHQLRKTPDESAMIDWVRQTNMYKIMAEHILALKIDNIQMFCIVRDGGTINAKNNGLFKNTYLIDVPVKDKQEILTYYLKKKEDLLSALKSPEMPPECTTEETWDGIRCDRYCPVAHMCGKKTKG